MSRAFINESTLTAIGDAIRAKTGKSDLIAPGDMPTEIENIPTGGGDLPEEAFVITGNCNYRFAYNGWNWVMSEFGNRITTQDITSFENMFYGTEFNIPFVIKGKSGTNLAAAQTFFNCGTETIQLKDISFSAMSSTFCGCKELRNISFENCTWEALHSASATAYSGNAAFQNCYSLRNISEDALKQIYNPKCTSKYYLIYQNGFRYCYALDEIRGISPISGALTSNCFENTFGECFRVSNIVFDTQADGTPYSANWKNQTISLSGVGHVATSRKNYILNTNSGITADKEVIDDASYQALKDDPDWFTCNINYSRYNHDSAVNTINSLPDCSASGGANTITFTGAAGALTDGGAINTLTEEEIAVAAAKGWTVTLA